MKAAPSASYFLLGVALGILVCQLNKIQWSYEIDVVDLSTLLLGGFIAVVLQSHISKRQSDGREEKKLLLDQLGEIFQNLEEVRSDYMSSLDGTWNAQKARATKANLRKLANRLNIFEHSLSLCSQMRAITSAKELRSKYLQCKASITGKQYPKKPIGDEELIEAESATQALSQLIISLQFEVNRTQN